MVHSGDFDLIVLDEISIALWYDDIDVQTVIAGFESRAIVPASSLQVATPNRS
jgi:ATP:corrinoid adenosyltransferase